MMERHNRKSHLAPQLSPSTQSLLRGDSVVSPSKESSASRTPTSGEIPIAGGDMKPPPLETPAVQRSNPTDIEGSIISAFSTPVTSYERPFFPPRTSSNPVVHSVRSRDSETFNNIATSLRHRSKEIDGFSSTTVIPIRPAPPPSGPLPPPPSASLRNSASRRQVTNGLSYANSEIPQY